MSNEKKEAALPEALAARLAESVAPIAPLPDRVAAVKARIVARVRRKRSPFRTVHAGDGGWGSAIRAIRRFGFTRSQGYPVPDAADRADLVEYLRTESPRQVSGAT